MNHAPIVLFVYNRIWHTQQTVEALKQNLLAQESDLFIFSDGFKDESDKIKVEEVRNYIKTVTGFKSINIIEREKNLGLADSIISGVTELVNKYGKVIVLEDDIVTSPYFLKYMNETLSLYEDSEEVISIHGYVYPIKNNLPETFFIKGADCWGWATWKRGWDLFEQNGLKLLNQIRATGLEKSFNFDNSYDYAGMLDGQTKGKNNSWAVRWYASAFLKKKLTLYPGRSLVKNIGMDNSGRHSGKTHVFDQELTKTPISIEKIVAIENKSARKEFVKFFKSTKPRIARRVLNKFNKILCSLKK